MEMHSVCVAPHNLFSSLSSKRSAVQPTVAQSKLCGVSKVAQSKLCGVSKAERLQWRNPRWWKFTAAVSSRKGNLNSRKRSSPCSCATRKGEEPEPVPEEDKDKSERLELRDLDWRSFRARLVASETQDGEEAAISQLGPSSKWAHPIHVVESGCVLVATEKLDGAPSFERSVVLLIKAGGGSNHPFGIILNRPLQRCVKDMKPSDPDLATTFAHSPLHFGGPLEASMFLLSAGKKKNVTRDFGEVIPGLCYGARYSLHRAAELVKNNVLGPQDVRFFLGYAGWESNQLREEIEQGLWYAAACSPNLITADAASSSRLWEEILQLMGGHYAELSRKPKEDNP